MQSLFLSCDLLALLELQGLCISTYFSVHFETRGLWSLGFFFLIKAQANCYRNICDHMRWVIKDKKSVFQKECYSVAALALCEMTWAQVAEVSTGSERLHLWVAGVSLLLLCCKFIALLVSERWPFSFVQTTFFPFTVISLVSPGASITSCYMLMN